MTAPAPDNNAKRLDALRRYVILDRRRAPIEPLLHTRRSAAFRTTLRVSAITSRGGLDDCRSAGTIPGPRPRGWQARGGPGYHARMSLADVLQTYRMEIIGRWADAV